MALIELFAADLATTTVSAGGTDAPSAGTVETLIVASAAMFGTAVAGVSQFHFADAAPGRGSEICAATATSGTTWTVTRGADGTTPVTHEAGFQIVQVFTAGWLASLVQTTGAAPSAGAAPISDASGNARWSGIFGTRPEWFGTISGTSGDEVAINAAIAAVAAGAAGCPGPVVITQPCGISNTITAQPGVNLAATGQGNRQVFPDTFKGGYIFPSPSFSTAGVPLITIGTSGAPTTNPCGIRLDGICLSGLLASGSSLANAIGMLVTDTADVHLIGCFLAGFDRAGGTGTCGSVSSATAGNGVGLNLQNCVISSSWRGVYTTGAGVTDMRYSGNLWHSNTLGLTLGASNLGGGGGQITNDHFTYSGMPSSGYHLSIGSQAGDFAFSNNYFDQAGSAIPVQLASAKGLFNGNHFLATSTSTAATLVKLSTSASQELTFCNNNCNGNGSSITSLFQTTAHSGAPTGGVYTGNTVYGGAASLIAVLIDSAGTAIAAASTSSLYVAGNCSFT